MQLLRAAGLAIGVSLDKPEDDPKRRIAIINDAGREIGNVPVYSRLHTKIRPNNVVPLLLIILQFAFDLGLVVQHRVQQ